ncbi:MAG: type II toxin-antitoxin system VapC family toxin [Caulobacteraceae bacterium]
MSVVVDASVAVKWLIPEEGSDAAKRLIADEILVAPDLLFAECVNVLGTKTRRGDLTAMFAEEALAVLESVPIRSVAARLHIRAAYAVASELDRSAYDALYLAVAPAERATLVTADATFAAAALAHPVYRASLRLLET